MTQNKGHDIFNLSCILIISSCIFWSLYAFIWHFLATWTGDWFLHPIGNNGSALDSTYVSDLCAFLPIGIALSWLVFLAIVFMIYDKGHHPERYAKK